MIEKLHTYFTRDIHKGIKCTRCKKRIHADDVTDYNIVKTVALSYSVKVSYVCRNCGEAREVIILVNKKDADRNGVEYYVKSYFEFSL